MRRFWLHPPEQVEEPALERGRRGHLVEGRLGPRPRHVTRACIARSASRALKLWASRPSGV